MREHLRACLWLLGFTVVLCAVLYPPALLAIGQALFHDRAEGSLVSGADGKVVGSRLIAQNFSGNGYFWPRPSAASYNGAASGGSNLAASNPQLRERVARQLGPLVRYGKGAEEHGKKPGDLVGPDVEDWFWRTHSDGPQGLLALGLRAQRTEIQSAFFDAWRGAHADVPLELVPADMVMTSGSGLDPHITLDNALYQVRHRIAETRAEAIIEQRKLSASRRQAIRAQVRDSLVKFLDELASAPLWGLVGVPLVNVLEVNLALDGRMKQLAETVK